MRTKRTGVREVQEMTVAMETEEPMTGDMEKPSWSTSVMGLDSMWWGPSVSGIVKKMH
jgi:hypothetical protein